MRIFKTAFLLIPLIFSVLPSSTNYQLKSYGVNSGGTNTSTSTTYKLQGASGEITSGNSAGTTYTVKSGSIQYEQANVPSAPTLSNNSGAYTDRLNFIINKDSNDPTDAKYSVAVSTTSGFVSTSYVQGDGTLNTTPVYQTYSAWGNGTGTLALGLTSGTAYWFKVNSTQGTFTATAYGLSSTISTGVAGGPTLSFALSPTNLAMGALAANSVVTSPSNISMTFATNASHGGSIYMAGSDLGLKSVLSSNYTIKVSPPSGDLTTLAEGFGLQDVTAATGMTKSSPYDGTSNVVGAIYTTFQPIFTATATVSSGTSTANLLAKAQTSTPSASDYTETLTIIAAASY